jgi:hypothetical protein
MSLTQHKSSQCLYKVVGDVLCQHHFYLFIITIKIAFQRKERRVVTIPIQPSTKDGIALLLLHTNFHP